MKKSFLFVLIIASACTGWAQSTAKPKTTTAKPPVKTPVKTTPAAPVCRTLEDSASYAMGMGAASFYKQQGITKINMTLFNAGINDVMNGKNTQFDGDAANTAMNKMMMQLYEAKSKPNIDAGKTFLATNKKKAGVITTASGLQYEVITQGTGIRPTAEDTFVVNYRGTLLNGTEFDASYNRGQPLTMPLNQVIRGWTEGLQLMPAGSKYKFYIPYELGYGTSDQGQIPGGSTLVFEIELLDVKKAQ